MGTKIGRPVSKNPKNARIDVRVSPREKIKIMNFSKEYGVTILELIREGMEAVKNK